jgi:alkaline phosphatase D
MPDTDLEVGWEVASDEAFATVVAEGTATATARHGHAVHADATGLEPATSYWYRFRVGGETSAVGQTRTLPVGDPERFKLAVANCQMLDGAAYGAYRHMADEDLDLVLHLGDYIYEYPGLGAAGGGSEPMHLVTTLTDFRLRYASYKLDADLQAAHAQIPWVVTWDDHEVANNYTSNTVPEPVPEDEVRALRIAAYQAWWEHLPVRLDPPQEDRLEVHRAFTIGSLTWMDVLTRLV